MVILRLYQEHEVSCVYVLGTAPGTQEVSYAHVLVIIKKLEPGARIPNYQEDDVKDTLPPFPNSRPGQSHCSSPHPGHPIVLCCRHRERSVHPVWGNGSVGAAEDARQQSWHIFLGEMHLGSKPPGFTNGFVGPGLTWLILEHRVCVNTGTRSLEKTPVCPDRSALGLRWVRASCVPTNMAPKRSPRREAPLVAIVFLEKSHKMPSSDLDLSLQAPKTRISLFCSSVHSGDDLTFLSLGQHPAAALVPSLNFRFLICTKGIKTQTSQGSRRFK